MHKQIEESSEKVNMGPETNSIEPKTIWWGFRAINLLSDNLATITGIGMLLAVMLQIVGRWLGTPLPWTEEATRFSFIWMVFLGIGIGFRHVESARVISFLAFLPSWVRRLAPYLYVVTTIGFFLLMLFTGAQLVGQQISMTEMGAALQVPMWIIGVSVPVAAVLGIVSVVQSILYDRSRLKADKDLKR